MKNLTTQKYIELKGKADKWDALDKKIGEMYYDKYGNELDADDGSDLCDIGELAAMAFKYL